MSAEITPVLRRSWRAQAPSITDAEIAILVEVYAGGGSPVTRLLRAYRRGLRDATPAEQPLAGAGRCPTCESPHVASVLWQTHESPLPGTPGYAVRWDRCAEDGTIYRPATGEILTGPIEALTTTTEGHDDDPREG